MEETSLKLQGGKLRTKRAMLLYLSLLLLSIVHIQSSCVNRGGELPKPKELPPITTEGRNTIGFLLNGEVWLPKGGAIGNPDKDFVMDTFSNTFRLISYYHEVSSTVLRQDFLLRIIWDERDCHIGDREVIGGNGRFFSDYSISNNCVDFKKLNDFKVNIIYCDLDKQIISGTFEMKIENDCGDIYSITEGRFDSNIRYY